MAGKSAVKSLCLTGKLPLKLRVLSVNGAGGIRNVAVKCIDITKNTDSAGSLPGYN